MVEEYEVIFTEGAKQSLQEIQNWIKEEGSESSAEKVKEGLLFVIDGLKKMPNRYGILHELKSENRKYRRALKWSYKIIYTIKEDTAEVYVVDIIHSKRGPKYIEERLGR